MSFIDKARAKAHLVLLSKGKKPVNVNVPEIPKDWDFFLGTKDRWVEVVFPIEMNSSNAIYEAEEGSIFPPHIHKYSDEMITVLNPEGKVKVLTEDEIVHIEYGESFVFPYGKIHAVVFETKTTLFIHWHPHFEKGWDAEFIETEEK